MPDLLDELDDRCEECGALIWDERCRACGRVREIPHVERPTAGDDLPGIRGWYTYARRVTADADDDIDREYVSELVERISTATDVHGDLGDIYGEAKTAGVLACTTDAMGTSIEMLLWMRRSDLMADELQERLQPGSSNRLREALTTAGIGRAEMAAHLGVSPSTIANYTRGRTTPTGSALEQWAAKTGATLQWLVTGAR